jgi:SPP1 gp7 family putative phage head morphogenesis protein
MIRYNITDLLRRTGRRSANVILPPISERLSMQRSYLAAMRRLIKALSREIINEVLVRYGQLVGRYTQDADAQSFDRLKRIAERLVSIAQETVDRILILESQKHTEQFIDVARKTLGIDVSAVVKQEDIGEYLDLAARRNADLIKSQTDTMIRRIEQATLQNILAGNPVSALRKKFIDEFGIADRKAKLLARDQSSKLTSDLNRIRQTQAGIDEYEWMTAHDERVRPLHRSIDGKRYQWGKPTGAEQGLPPGQPIQCRCVARGIVQFGKAVETRTPNEQIDADIRQAVVSEGKRTNTEHLMSYDAVTGVRLADHTTGQKSHVGFSPEFAAAIADPKRKIIAHHNHPSSSSFSKQDILELSRNPGLKGLWAHGHDGSSYYAEWKAVATKFKRFDHLDQSLQGTIQPYVYPRREMTPDEARFVWAHVTMLAAKKIGLVEYRAMLSGDAKKAIDKFQNIIDDIMRQIK